MTELTPLETLYEAEPGHNLLLPPELSALYGRLSFPAHPGRPHVFANFVTSLDGVVSLKIAGQSGGGEISGFNKHDHAVMGLLRAVADTIIVGAGTLRESRAHHWTAAYIYPPLAQAYQSLRTRLGKSEPPLNVFVTAHGEVDLKLPVFQSGEVSVLIVTTPAGDQRIREQKVPPSVQIVTVQSNGSVSARQVLEAVHTARQSDLILVEGGSQLMGDFFAEHCLDELFLTLSPQVVGRDGGIERPGLVAGKNFAPEHPVWGKLVSVKRGESHLFLRYAFDS